MGVISAFSCYRRSIMPMVSLVALVGGEEGEEHEEVEQRGRAEARQAAPPAAPGGRHVQRHRPHGAARSSRRWDLGLGAGGRGGVRVRRVRWFFARGVEHWSWSRGECARWGIATEEV